MTSEEEVVRPDATTQVAVSPQKMEIKTIITLVGVALGLFMGALEGTIIGTAMPTIIATLHGIEIYSWVFAAYILAATIMTPIWGKMADLIGRRPAIFSGIALFIIGSALSGLATSMPQLIVFRAIQGLGSGALFPVGITIVADLLTLERRAKVVGLFSGMWGLASLIGPLAGGWLTDHLSWRWVFYINLPFGLLAAIMIWWGYTEKHARHPELHLDYAGAITLSVALLLLLLTVEAGAKQPALVTFAGLAGSVLLLVAFVTFERRSPEPLIPPDLFQNRLVQIVTLHGLFIGAVLLGTMSFLPLFVQAVIGTTATEAGTILTPFILSWVVSSTLGARLVLRTGYRLLTITGMALILTGTLILANVSVTTVRIELVVAVILMGLGGGTNMSTLMIGVQHAVAVRRMGVATSTVQLARNIGAALGTGAMGALMSWRLTEHLIVGGSQFAELAGSGHDVSSIVVQSASQPMSAAAMMFLRAALAGSLRLSFIFVLGCAVAAIIVAFFVPGGKARDLAHPEQH